MQSITISTLLFMYMSNSLVFAKVKIIRQVKLYTLDFTRTFVKLSRFVSRLDGVHQVREARPH